MDEYSSIYSQPKTPRLKQEGFPDSIGDQHEKALIDENGEEDKKMAWDTEIEKDFHTSYVLHWWTWLNVHVP